MELFKGLHEALGKPAHQKIPPDSFFKSHTKKIHEDLLALWREDGWASYGKGLFWTVNPDDYSEIIRDWKTIDKKLKVFGRNAFGDLFLTGKNELSRLKIQTNRWSEIGSDVYIFLNVSLKQKNLQETFLQSKLFRKVYKLLGELEADECYGLFPALPLGGDEDDPKGYRKVKIREYLSSVAQMH